MRVFLAVLAGTLFYVTPALARIEGVCFDLDTTGPKNEVRNLEHRIELFQPKAPFQFAAVDRMRYLNFHYMDELYERKGGVFSGEAGFSKLIIHRFLNKVNAYEGAFLTSRTRAGLDEFEGRTWIYVRCMDLATAKRLHGFEVKQ